MVQTTATCRRRLFSHPAIAARTERLLLSLVVILPFYDPVRLAEDLCRARHHQRRTGRR